ncbi:MAG: NADH-quinone oxidoreductase subunit NuoK [Nitrospirae bacterium]|jgi:NADH-quinone oxidoreductase subunit K|uniref:NADH-quinone oxidoreductase subunit K n=1 Tax=Leptospirillum ferrodiazotrophum TaxID=412449 RepID=C6HUH7_9BACT|nr:MAG: putative NADH dehydrogenase (ubiquinone), chain 4L [Leptospirillum ferrodiazotrophum]MCL5953923.1 NADH-quinone oxidoreductase subunit NuoK [Nitrospirota bacterium]
MVPLSWYVALSAMMFVTGLVGVLIRRNIVVVLLCIEIMLNAVNINFVAFSDYLHLIDGQIFVFFVITVAAAEVAIGLGIIISLFRLRESVNMDDYNLLKL